MVALDGEPTPRFRAVTRAIEQIKGLGPHLPLEAPRSDVAVVYDAHSHEIFQFNEEDERFMADLRGVSRTLWLRGIQADPVTPKMDWSGYRLLVLPNVALMADATREHLARTLDENPDMQVLIEGSFGTYSDDGQSSYQPPEGFADRFGVRVADFSAVTESDIAHGRNVLETPQGPVPITTPCGYAILEPQGSTQAIARIGDHTVGVRTGDGRVTWYGLTLAAGFGDVAPPAIVEAAAADAGVSVPVMVEGDPHRAGPAALAAGRLARLHAESVAARCRGHAASGMAGVRGSRPHRGRPGFRRRQRLPGHHGGRGASACSTATRYSPRKG